MTKVNDGGSAFPSLSVPESNHFDFEESGSQGMSLRAWFAGQALASLGRYHDLGDRPGEEQRIVKACVVLADALIAELAKGKSE